MRGEYRCLISGNATHAIAGFSFIDFSSFSLSSVTSSTSPDATEGKIISRCPCTECPPKTYWDGERGCVLCPAGTSSQRGGGTSIASCRPCRPHEWSIAGGACTKCPAGTSSPRQRAQGEGSCAPCVAGYISTAGGPCVPCSPGTFSYPGSDVCLACPENHFCLGPSPPTSCPKLLTQKRDSRHPRI